MLVSCPGARDLIPSPCACPKGSQSMFVRRALPADRKTNLYGGAVPVLKNWVQGSFDQSVMDRTIPSHESCCSAGLAHLGGMTALECLDCRHRNRPNRLTEEGAWLHLRPLVVEHNLARIFLGDVFASLHNIASRVRPGQAEPCNDERRVSNESMREMFSESPSPEYW